MASVIDLDTGSIIESTVAPQQPTQQGFSAPTAQIGGVIDLNTGSLISQNPKTEEIQPEKEVLQSEILQSQQEAEFSGANPRARRGSKASAVAKAKKEEFLSSLTPGRRKQLENINPVEAGLIGVGRGLTTIGRGVGLAEQETVEETQGIDELKQLRPTAMGTGEIIGQVAPFVPLGLGAAAIASLPARVGASMALGATEGGIIRKGEGGDFSDTIQGGGVGALVAGSVELGVPIFGRLGGRIIRRITGQPPTSPVLMPNGQPSQELAESLEQAGLSFDDIGLEAQRLLQTGDVLDPAALARRGFLEEQGLIPTRAQVTGDPGDFQSQQELFKSPNRVRRALEGQETELSNRFENAITATGGSANASRSTAIDLIADRSIDQDRAISEAYKAAREAAPLAKVVRPNNSVAFIRSIAGSDNATGGLAGAARDILRARGLLPAKGLQIQGRVTPEVAESIRIDMNGLYDSLTPFGRQKLAGLKDSLDKDVQEGVGFDVFKEARAAKAKFEKDLSRAKVNKFDKRKKNLVRDIFENKVNPDRFLNEAIISKSIRSDDVEQLKRFLIGDESSQGPLTLAKTIEADGAGRAAWNDIRLEAMQRIKNDSFKDIGGQEFITATRLQKALDTFGRDKLRVLFSGEERKFLNDLGRVTKIREPKASTAIGRGPSSQAIQKLETGLKKIPLIGQVFEGMAATFDGRVALFLPSPTPLQPSVIAPIAGAAAVAGTLSEEDQ